MLIDYYSGGGWVMDPVDAHVNILALYKFENSMNIIKNNQTINFLIRIENSGPKEYVFNKF